MSRLDIATERFNEVLEALEEAVVPLAGLRTELAESQAKSAELASEREQLLARIAELEGENRALSEIAEEVEGRLDGAIGEIRVALGR
jgi:chromosome segregation ATPase